MTAMVALVNSSLEDHQWFAYSGANSLITSELENLTI
jgi:hypothetical protein